MDDSTVWIKQDLKCVNFIATNMKTLGKGHSIHPDVEVDDGRLGVVWAPDKVRCKENYRAPHAPSGVAAFMSAHSKTPYITPNMDFSSGKGVVPGRRGQQLEFAVR